MGKVKKFGKGKFDDAWAGVGGAAGGKSGKGWADQSTTSCRDKHPVLSWGGGTLYGGSCISPLIRDADVYVGFDAAMELTDRRFPWAAGDEVFFPVKDQQPPKSTDTDRFKKLVTWTAEQLKAGRRVHCGCIGGHGRTGTFFAALYHEITGEKDAIAKVRELYCKKAVETTGQVEWLVKHYGLKPAPARHAASSTVTSWGGNSALPGPGMGSSLSRSFGEYELRAMPVASKLSIWGANKRT